MKEVLLSVWVSQDIGRSMNIATFSTQDLREQGRKSYVASYRANEYLVSRECFLVNYVNEGDSRKVSSVGNSQYTVLL